MGRLDTRYLGLELRSPLVASAGPLTAQLDAALRMQEAGAAAIVLPSLFEEEIAHEDSDLVFALEAGSEHFAEALSYFPNLDSYPSTAEYYLSLVSAAKQQLSVPLIASLNATTGGGWVRYAKLIEEAGADALELNLYRVAADPSQSGSQVEASELEVVGSVRDCLSIPLAVKLAPFYSSFANFAGSVCAAGADGLVLMNRFYQPDLDPDSREVVPRIELSRPWELRLPLRWVAILRSQLAPGASLAITTGVQRGADAAKALLVGADIAMMTSAILRYGPGHFATVEAELVDWMDAQEYDSVDQLRGSASYAAADDPSAFERANYRRTLHSWTAPYRLTPQAPTGESG